MLPPALIVSFVVNLIGGGTTENVDEVDDEAYDKGSLTGESCSSNFVVSFFASLVEGSTEDGDEGTLTGREAPPKLNRNPAGRDEVSTEKSDPAQWD